MRRRLNGWTIALLALIAVGVIRSFVQNPLFMLLPIVIFGIIFLLYKYPPARYRRGYQPPRVKQADRHRAKQAPRKRTSPLRVIEGGKDDDDLPKYH